MGPWPQWGRVSPWKQDRQCAERERGWREDRRHLSASRHQLGDILSWRKKYSGMDASEAKRLRELEVESSKLKRKEPLRAIDSSTMANADQMLDMTSMKDLLQKHW